MRPNFAWHRKSHEDGAAGAMTGAAPSSQAGFGAPDSWNARGILTIGESVAHVAAATAEAADHMRTVSQFAETAAPYEC